MVTWRNQWLVLSLLAATSLFIADIANSEPIEATEPPPEEVEKTDKTKETTVEKDEKAEPHEAAKEADATEEKVDEDWERPEPKPISNHVDKALKYLLDQQNQNGGWGQGGGWRTKKGGGREEGAEVADPSDVGNTCIAALALIRAGNSPTNGPFSKELSKAVQFIQGEVNTADAESLYVTSVRNTQLQSKIGQYVDTFLTGLVLAELKGEMPTEDSEAKLLATLNKTIGKIAKNQKKDGTFAGNRGWASVLSQGLCSKFLNGARQKGVQVDDLVLSRDWKQANQQLAASTRRPVAAGASMPISRGLAGADVSEVSGPVPSVDAAVKTKIPAVPASSKVSKTAIRGDVGGTALYGGVAPGGAADAGVQLYSFSSNANRINAFGMTGKKEMKRLSTIAEDESKPDDERDAARRQLQEFELGLAAQQQASSKVSATTAAKNF